MNDERIAQRLGSRVVRALCAKGAWLVYAGVALACTKYLNLCAQLVPSWGEGEWWSDGQPYVLLQIRAFLAGRTSIFPHPAGAGHDYNWGRGGMHQAWGLGVPILAMPFHLLGRLFGAPGFPDHVFFLFLYAVTAFVLARTLHGTARNEPTALIASASAAGFVMIFPTFVGLVASRFLIYELTIAVGVLWNVLLLSGVLLLLKRYTTARFVIVCAMAGFAIVIRPPLAIYGLTTMALAGVIAWKRGASARGLLAGLSAYLAATAVFLGGNALRFGSPFTPGYANSLSGAFVNRLTRWGLPFVKEPLRVQVREMFATLFLLDPVSSQIMMGTPPISVRSYAIGERWREYYSPTFDRLIFVLWMAAIVIVVVGIARRRLWRRDQDLGSEVAITIGAWALPPSLALFAFYAHVGQVVTRYAGDFYPAIAGALLCVGMTLVDLFRAHGPLYAPAVQLAIASAFALYNGTWRGWATELSHPQKRAHVEAWLAQVDSHLKQQPPVPDHFKCGEPRGEQPVYSHLQDWEGSCFFHSGMVFAMKHSPCVSFAFGAAGPSWGPPEDEALAAIRVNADFDAMTTCAPAVAEGETRRIIMCDPRPPKFLLDGMRLYSLALLNEKLEPLDRLKLLAIAPEPSCR